MASIACLSICSASAFGKIPFFTRAVKASWVAWKAAILIPTKSPIALVLKYFDQLVPFMQELDTNLRPAD